MELGRKGYVQRENELGRRPRELGNQVGKTSKSRAARKNAGRPTDCQDGVENPEREEREKGEEVEWRLHGPINLRAVVRRLTFSVSKMNFPWGVEQGNDVI